MDITIRNIGGKLQTTSLNIAHVLGKQHKNVIRDIEKLDCSPEFRRLNFELSSYKGDSDQKREYKKYTICKDGFAFLIMGYKGKKAAGLKKRTSPHSTKWKLRIRNAKILLR